MRATSQWTNVCKGKAVRGALPTAPPSFTDAIDFFPHWGSSGCSCARQTQIWFLLHWELKTPNFLEKSKRLKLHYLLRMQITFSWTESKSEQILIANTVDNDNVSNNEKTGDIIGRTAECFVVWKSDVIIQSIITCKQLDKRNKFI